MVDRVTCARCDGAGWVCEGHTDTPWLGTSNRADACGCGGAGDPCPDCNELALSVAETKLRRADGK